MGELCSYTKPCDPQPGTCLYYSGNALVGPNIQSGDNFNTVVVKLNNYINTLGVNVTGTNLGISGARVFVQKSGNVFQFRRLVAGANVTIIENADDITIQASGSGGGAGDGGILSINGLTPLTQTINVGTSGSDFGINSSGSTHTINLPIASGTNTGKLSSTDWSYFNTKVDNGTNLGTGEIVFKQKTSNNLEFKTLKVSGGLAISSTGTDITIDGSAIVGGGEANTASNLGVSGARVFSAKVGVDLQFRRISASSGISVTENANTIAIGNTAPDQTVVITAGSNITVTGTYPNFTISAPTPSVSWGSITAKPLPTKWSFIVGAGQPMIAGQSTFSDPELVNADVDVYRGSILQADFDAGLGGSFYTKTSLSSNTITFSPAVADGEFIYIRIHRV